MHKMTQPPLSTRCQKCGGELLLKKIEAANAAIDLDMEVFVCSKCGCEQVLTLNHDPHSPHTGSPR